MLGSLSGFAFFHTDVWTILARAFISVQQRFLFNKASYVIFQEEQTCRRIIRQSEFGGSGGGGWCYLKVKLSNRSTRACGDGGRAQWGGKGVKRYAVKYKETRASPSPRGSPPKGWLHTLVTHHPSNPRSQLSEHRLIHCVTVHIRYHHTYLWKKRKELL